jgi:hypothetical protein
MIEEKNKQAPKLDLLKKKLNSSSMAKGDKMKQEKTDKRTSLPNR